MSIFEENNGWIFVAIIVVFILFAFQDDGVNGGFFD